MRVELHEPCDARASSDPDAFRARTIVSISTLLASILSLLALGVLRITVNFQAA
jgi:hypothetical protein